MRKLILALSLLSFVPIFIVGQTTKKFHIEFDNNDFIFKMYDSCMYINSTKYLCAYNLEKPKAMLPYIIVNLLIPQNEIYQGVDFNCCDIPLKEHVHIGVPPNAINTFKEVHYKEELQKKTNDGVVRYLGTHLMDGYKYLSFALCPFRYNEENESLHFYNSFDVQVQLIEGTCFQNKPFGNAMRNIVRNIVFNAEELDTLYRNDRLKDNKSNLSTNYEYAIVTNQTLKSTFQKLADWKTKKGVNTTVITVESIDSNYIDSINTGVRQQLRIKRALKDLKDNNTNLKYVLLGGDVEIIPDQKCFIRYRPLFSGYEFTRLTPTDLFYACFDTMDWDFNGNGIYGENDDNVDVDQDVILTRVPVSTIAQADGYVNRVISYEKGNNIDNWNGRILMAGKHLSYIHGCDTINGRPVSDAEYGSEWMYNDYIAPYWDGIKYRLYDTFSDFSDPTGGGDYDFDSANLQSQLSNGYTFVDINTHGLPDSWTVENGSYSVQQAQSLNNPGYTIITTSACFTNAFDSLQTCLSEAFFKNPNSGIIGYLGHSREGIFDENYTQFIGDSSETNGRIYKYLFTEKEKSFGSIVAMMKSKYAPRHTWTFSYEPWMLYGINPLGDPEMPIFISSPQLFNDIDFTYSNNTLVIDTGVDSCRICIMSTTDNGNSYYQVRKDVRTAAFSNIPNECSICITKTGYKPFFIADNAYIQDEIIIDDTEINAINVFVGKDVTTNKPQGPVVIESGRTKIKGAESVLIKNSFTVETGAELIINK